MQYFNWICAKWQYLQCVSNGDTAVFHQAIAIHPSHSCFLCISECGHEHERTPCSSPQQFASSPLHPPPVPPRRYSTSPQPPYPLVAMAGSPGHSSYYPQATMGPAYLPNYEAYMTEQYYSPPRSMLHDVCGSAQGAASDYYLPSTAWPSQYPGASPLEGTLVYSKGDGPHPTSVDLYAASCRPVTSMESKKPRSVRQSLSYRTSPLPWTSSESEPELLPVKPTATRGNSLQDSLTRGTVVPAVTSRGTQSIPAACAETSPESDNCSCSCGHAASNVDCSNHSTFGSSDVPSDVSSFNSGIYRSHSPIEGSPAQTEGKGPPPVPPRPATPLLYPTPLPLAVTQTASDQGLAARPASFHSCSGESDVSGRRTPADHDRLSSVCSNILERLPPTTAHYSDVSNSSLSTAGLSCEGDAGSASSGSQDEGSVCTVQSRCFCQDCVDVTAACAAKRRQQTHESTEPEVTSPLLADQDNTEAPLPTCQQLVPYKSHASRCDAAYPCCKCNVYRCHRNKSPYPCGLSGAVASGAVEPVCSAAMPCLSLTSATGGHPKLQAISELPSHGRPRPDCTPHRDIKDYWYSVPNSARFQTLKGIPVQCGHSAVTESQRRLHRSSLPPQRSLPDYTSVFSQTTLKPHSGCGPSEPCPVDPRQQGLCSKCSESQPPRRQQRIFSYPLDAMQQMPCRHPSWRMSYSQDSSFLPRTSTPIAPMPEPVPRVVPQFAVLGRDPGAVGHCLVAPSGDSGDRKSVIVLTDQNGKAHSSVGGLGLLKVRSLISYTSDIAYFYMLYSHHTHI